MAQVVALVMPRSSFVDTGMSLPLHPLLLSHIRLSRSMGGLLAADTIHAFIHSRPDASAPLWPNIIACIAFDTPVCSSLFLYTVNLANACAVSWYSPSCLQKFSHQGSWVCTKRAERRLGSLERLQSACEEVRGHDCAAQRIASSSGTRARTLGKLRTCCICYRRRLDSGRRGRNRVLSPCRLREPLRRTYGAHAVRRRPVGQRSPYGALAPPCER
jgi:hypothetical protein